MLTIQMLVRNNEDTVGRALRSIRNLGANVVVGDIGSEDSTPEICSEWGAEVVRVKWEEDYSKARNLLAREGMNMFLEPWEVFIQGHEAVSDAKENSTVYVVQNGVVSKETRLWRDSFFVNPVYETIADEGAVCVPGIVIASSAGPDHRQERTRIIRKWIENKPTSPDPYYYMAISCLAERKYEEFQSFARQYLVMNHKAGASAILLNYYMSQIEFRMGDMQSAVKKLMVCLSYCPEFAEFWCLLGDMLYRMQKYDKAKCMYENAMIIGKRRRGDDGYPIEVLKYGEYPRKMLASISDLSTNSTLVGSEIKS